MSQFYGEYCSVLGSDDLFDPDLPLSRKNPHGGTMIMWRRSLDPYVKPLPPPSSSILPLLFSPPGLTPSIHIAIYLPTAGKDLNFVEQISILHNFIIEASDQYPGSLVFLRGDSNVNSRNLMRVESLRKLCADLDLKRLELSHPTYHHFVGMGKSDSDLDVIIHPIQVQEKLIDIVCCLNDPTMSSHHDALITLCSIPNLSLRTNPTSHTQAHRIPNSHVKIHWPEEGAEKYSKCIGPLLENLGQSWLNSYSPSSLSILLWSTNYQFATEPMCQICK